MSTVLNLGKSPTCVCLGVECFQPPLDTSGELCVSSSSFSSLGSVQVPGRMWHRSVQMSYSSGTCWMEAPWLPTVLNMLADVHQCLILKDLVMDNFIRLGAQGSAITVFNPLAAQRCVLCGQVFSSTVCHAWVGMTQAFVWNGNLQWWKEWTGWCAWEGVLNNGISSPKLSYLLIHLFRVGLACCTICIYFSGISAFWDHIIFIMLQISWSSLN